MFGKSMRQRMIKGLAVCGLVVASLGMTQTASAQFGAMGGSDDVFRPDFTTRDVVLFVEGLNLDEGQRYIFETMFEMYQTDFDDGVEQVRDKLTNMRDDLVGGDPQEILKKVFEPVDEWRKTKQALAARLMMDLESQLSPQQKDMWPSFERKLRRIKTLKDGVLTGENIDLFFVLQQMDLSKAEKDSIAPIMARYEVSLDAALQARNQFVSKTQQDLSTAIRSQQVDDAKTIVEKQVSYRLTVRNTTEDTVKELMTALPEDKAAALRRTTMEQAYGQVFRLTQMERVFDQVLEMEDLTPEVMTAVKDLQQRYLAELSTINERLVSLIRDQDGVKIVERVERLVHRVNGENVTMQQDPVRDEYFNREALGNRYMTQLRVLLSPEQFSKVPGSAKVNSAGSRGAFSDRRINQSPVFTGAPRRAGGSRGVQNGNLGTAPASEGNPPGTKTPPKGVGGAGAPATDGGASGDHSGGTAGGSSGGTNGGGGATGNSNPRGGRGG